MAVCQWLGDGKDEAILVKTDSGNLRISLKPLSFTSSVGIDEDSEAGLEEEDEFQVLEENQEEDDDDTTEPA